MSDQPAELPLSGFWPHALALEQRAIQGAHAEIGAPIEAAQDDIHQAFRKVIPLETRRSFGAFFTSTSLAMLLIAEAQPATKCWFDPTCGVGDLLLAAANTLPVSTTLAGTLALWSESLSGLDLHEPLVRTAKARLILLARKRGRFNQPMCREAYKRSLASLAVADGLESTHKLPLGTTVLLNPPYGKLAVPAWVSWSQGTTNVASVFAARLLKRLAVGDQLLAILPEVLRIGSNYRRWRQLMDEACSHLTPKAHGAFDDHVLIDVFTMNAIKGSGQPRMWSAPLEATSLTRAPFTVTVGPVIPHRHRRVGPIRRYLDAKSLASFRIIHRVPERRRFTGRVFSPPFVVVKRTSSPSDRQRARASVVTGVGPVAIENHLIICKPESGSFEACVRLMNHLATDQVSEWLNCHHRCRHLTVSAVRSISAGIT